MCELREHIFQGLLSLIVRKECIQEEGSTTSTATTTPPSSSSSPSPPQTDITSSSSKPSAISEPPSLPLITIALSKGGGKGTERISSRVETYDDTFLKEGEAGLMKEELYFKVRADHTTFHGTD